MEKKKELRDLLELARNEEMENADTINLIDRVKAFINDNPTESREIMTAFLSYWGEHVDLQLEKLFAASQLLRDLEPELLKDNLFKDADGNVLDYLEKHYTVKEILDPEGEIFGAIERAALAKGGEEAIPTITARGVEDYPVALDQFNTIHVFDFLRSVEPTGQITMFPVKESDSPSIYSNYSLTFSDDLPPEIKRKLTPYDHLVYGAIDSVQKKNGNIMSIQQIHRAMGNDGSPNAHQSKKIHDSIIKVNAALATIDCGEIRDYYGNDGYIDYYGSLLPMEIQRAVINGQMVECAVHILRHELPLMSIARGRNHQIENIPTALLNSTLSQTDSNLAMEFHVLETILKLKRGSGIHNKILYSTIYEKMGAKNKKQKQRAKNAFLTYLDELIDKDFIKSYEEEKTDSTGEAGVKFEY